MSLTILIINEVFIKDMLVIHVVCCRLP